jgi:hypothetical protein
MPVCTRCRTQVAAGLTSCPSCKAPVMDVVRPAEPPEGAPKPDLPGVPRETPRGASAEGAVHGAAEPAPRSTPVTRTSRVMIAWCCCWKSRCRRWPR